MVNIIKILEHIMSNLFYSLLYVITLIIILAILFKNKPNSIDETYKQAEIETRFNPTFFLIYDKSTPEICDRLIVVQPFGWLIWAINNDVYVLDNAPGHQCPLGSSSAIRITNDIFTMNASCINILPTALLNLYNDPIKIEYDIRNSSMIDKFTVLDALNILFKKYITITFPTDSTIDNKLLTISNLNKQIIFDGNSKKITDNIIVKFSKLKPEIEAELFERLYFKTNN